MGVEMWLSYLDKLIFILLSFGVGYFMGKSNTQIISENKIKKIKKKISGGYGAVYKPKTQKEIDKERSKKFYEEL